MKMPVPIMIPMTMAVASHQPNARSNCGGAEAATVAAESFSGEFMEETETSPSRPDLSPAHPRVATQ